MIETQRLYLRNRTRTLLEEISLKTDKEQLLFFGLNNEDDLEDKWTRINRGLSNQSIGFRIFDLIDKESKKVIGDCGYHTWIYEHDRAEMGYTLHEVYRRKGLMGEAFERILRYGFEDMGLNRIEALISPNNHPSINLVVKHGFVKEGIMRGHYFIDDIYEDSISFSLLKSEFESSR